MKPHHFQSPAGIIDECELCGHSADHPIHEFDGVAIGDRQRVRRAGGNLTYGIIEYSVDRLHL